MRMTRSLLITMCSGFGLFANTGFALGGDPDRRTLMSGETRVAFSPDGKSLAVGDDQEGVTLWDVQARKAGVHFKTRDQVASVAFSPDCKTVAAGDVYGDLRLWDVATGRMTRTLSVSNTIGERMKQSRSPNHSVAFSPDGRTLASGLKDAVNLWDVSSGEIRARVAREMWFQDSVAFSPDGAVLAVIERKLRAENDAEKARDSRSRFASSCSIKVFDAETGRERRTIEIGSRSVVSLAFTRDGKTLFVGGMSPSLLMVDMASGRLRDVEDESIFSVNALAASRDGRFLACAGRSAVSLREARSGRLIKSVGLVFGAEEDDDPPVAIPHDIAALAFSPDGRTLAIRARDKVAPVTFWDVETIFGVVVEL
jgi:WD40 repeat protein